MTDSPSGGWREVYRWQHCPLPTDDPEDRSGEANQDDETTATQLGSENSA